MSFNKIKHWADTRPTKPAFISNDIVFTYREFASAIGACQRALEDAALPIGADVIVLSREVSHAWILVLALRALGLSTVVLQSLAQIAALKLMNVAAIVAPRRDEAAFDFDNRPHGAKLILIADTTLSNDIQGASTHKQMSRAPTGGHTLFTSGTTGNYKKLLVRGELEDFRNAVRADAFLFDDRTVYYAANFGLWTQIGFRTPLAVWHVGGSVIFDYRTKLSDSFFNHRVSFTMLTPSLLNELVAKARHRSPDNDCELIVTAGFLPDSLKKAATRLITKRIGITYGSTELSTPGLLSRSPDPLDWLQPGPGRTISIIDENGNECAVGQEGELRAGLMDIDCGAYLDDPKTTAKIFRGGYFCPGDMAVRRADGRIRILGRTADVLNVQGTKLAVAPLELRLQNLLEVNDVCLFSGLTTAGNSELIVAIETKKEKLPRVKLDKAARQFPSFETVRFSFHQEFPRTETGTQKVKREVLRKMIAQKS